MEQISISFEPQEGACPRLIRMVEWRGGRVVSMDFVEGTSDALSQLRVVYEDSGSERRRNALAEKIRGIPGVAHVTRGDQG